MTIFLWHAGLMLLCWLVLVPAGVLTARFFKVTRSQNYPREFDNKFWWRWHLRLQYSAWLLMNIAFLLIVSLRWNGEPASILTALLPSGPHGWFGLAAFVLAWAQMVSGWLRGTKGGPEPGWEKHIETFDPAKVPRGDHYNMTPRRRRFEAWHKIGGYFAWLFSILAGQTGLWLLQAPGWLLALHLLLGLSPIALFMRFSAQRRWLPTYQAIWGPDSRHPGNRPG